MRVDELAKRVRYRLDEEIGEELATLTVKLAEYGTIKLMILREEKGAKEGSKRKRSYLHRLRWS
ncbi:MAG: hypothetical protein ACUVTP_13285 [Candidatus Fervidibacter sp.]|uniref:hypothetical protein n=1 Tax=Candidatus Fervidibacter sp. TaxID=3100871 RepID=UPI00404AD752